MCSSQHFEGKPLDVWALGVTLYCMLFGTVPFCASTTPELHRLIQTSEPSYTAAYVLGHLLNAIYPHSACCSAHVPSPIILSAAAQGMIQRMLIKSPRERLSITEVREQPWMHAFPKLPPLPSEYANTVAHDSDSPTEEEVASSFVTITLVSRRPSSVCGGFLRSLLSSSTHTLFCFLVTGAAECPPATPQGTQQSD